MRTTIIALAGLAFMQAAPVVQAQRAAFRAQNTAARPTPSLRVEVYEQLSQAQHCAEAKDWTCASSIIDTLKARDDLRSYERAQTANFEAFIAFSNDDRPAAIEAYERMLSERDIPRGLESNTQYTLAQLYASEQRYDDALERLDAWWPENGPARPEPYVFRGQLEYQREDPDAGLAAVDAGLDRAAEAGLEPDEQLFKMKVALQEKLGDTSGAARTLEEMIRLWPKREYYEKLTAVVTELGDEPRRLQLLEAGYASGWLETSDDLLSFAQGLVAAGRAEDAGSVLGQGLEQGTIARDDLDPELLGLIGGAP